MLGWGVGEGEKPGWEGGGVWGGGADISVGAHSACKLRG